MQYTLSNFRQLLLVKVRTHLCKKTVFFLLNHIFHIISQEVNRNVLLLSIFIYLTVAVSCCPNTSLFLATESENISHHQSAVCVKDIRFPVGWWWCGGGAIAVLAAATCLCFATPRLIFMLFT